MPYALEALSSESFTSLGNCPFHEGGAVCRAAFSALPVDGCRTRRFCSGQDYDLCPLFLAKVLRGSSPRYCGSSCHDRAEK